MNDHAKSPVTLGDKLKLQWRNQRIGFAQVLLIAAIILISAIISILSWLAFNTLYPALAALIIGAIDIFIIFISFIKLIRRGWKDHFLIKADPQGFMPSLRLSDKTVLFDGSNIYHFGLDNGLGRKVLELLIHELRSDGFRLICFFDANIYYTLLENGEFSQDNERFSINVLQRIFGLKESEIYVVPAGTQADQFIIESLSLLPISFAVTNDRYRDYQAKYDFLPKIPNGEKGWKSNTADCIYNSII